MTIGEVKEQAAEHARLTTLRTQVVKAQETAALPDGSVTFTITVIHRQNGTGKQSTEQAEITLNSAEIELLLNAEQADLDAAVDLIEQTFAII